jgi:hypothetical protein
MAVSGTEIFLGGTAKIFSFPKSNGATAVEHGIAEGLDTQHLGNDLLFAGGSLFSVDTTSTVNVSRLFRVFDGAAWGPTAWDLSPAYPSTSPSHALAYDGTTMFMATRRTSTNANFYSFSTSAPGAPVLLGTNAGVWYVTGMAADDQFLYVASNGSAGEGIYRLSKASIASPAVKIATLDTDTAANNVEIDAFVNPKNLYVCDALGDVHAIVDPGLASFAHLGVISTLGTTSDFAMTYDKADGVLYIFETESDTAGRIVRLQ